MEIIASLIREFPFGSFIIILAVLWACERVVTSIINRNKPTAPNCNCDCCEGDDDDDEPEGDRVIMGGEEEDQD